MKEFTEFSMLWDINNCIFSNMKKNKSSLARNKIFVSNKSPLTETSKQGISYAGPRSWRWSNCELWRWVVLHGDTNQDTTVCLILSTDRYFAVDPAFMLQLKINDPETCMKVTLISKRRQFPLQRRATSGPNVNGAIKLVSKSDWRPSMVRQQFQWLYKRARQRTSHQ